MVACWRDVVTHLGDVVTHWGDVVAHLRHVMAPWGDVMAHWQVWGLIEVIWWHVGKE